MNYCSNCGAKLLGGVGDSDLSAYGIEDEGGGILGGFLDGFIFRNPTAGLVKGPTTENKCPKCGEEF